LNDESRNLNFFAINGLICLYCSQCENYQLFTYWCFCISLLRSWAAELMVLKILALDAAVW